MNRPGFRLTLAYPVLLAFVVLVAGCGASLPTKPFQLNGIWGGVMNHAGTDYFLFAMDVTTSATGAVTGIGIVTDDPSGQTGALVMVTGTTQPAAVTLTLTDLANDTVRLTGNVEGAVVRGAWTYPSGDVSGSFRMAAQENIDLLSRPTPAAASHAQLLAALLR